MVNIVVFQFISGFLIILTLLLITYLIYKNADKKLIYSASLLLLVEIFLSNILYFNFTGSDERVKEESFISDMIYQTKKVPPKKAGEFNYSKEFKSVSNDIETESNKIHKSIKEEK